MLAVNILLVPTQGENPLHPIGLSSFQSTNHLGALGQGTQLALEV